VAKSNLAPRIHILTHGEQKDVFKIFRKYLSTNLDKADLGWFIANQYLTAGGRSSSAEDFVVEVSNKHILTDNDGLIVIDDSGHPPELRQKDLFIDSLV